jgi:hypothetical protein
MSECSLPTKCCTDRWDLCTAVLHPHVQNPSPKCLCNKNVMLGIGQEAPTILARRELSPRNYTKEPGYLELELTTWIGADDEELGFDYR